MELNQALMEGQNFLRNGQDAAARSPVNPDTLYLWDNQVQAMETFIADTETMAAQDEKLAALRAELRDVKKQVELKVLEFELKQEGEEMPPEPTDDELIEDYQAYAEELASVLDDLEKAKIGTLKDVEELEEPRAMLNNFLVETEPLIGRAEPVDKVRGRAREVKMAIDANIDEVVQAWRSQDAD